MIERVYGCSSVNVVIQDEPDARYSVPHVHALVIPGREADLDDVGGGGEVEMLLWDVGGGGRGCGKQMRDGEGARPRLPAVDNEGREARGGEGCGDAEGGGVVVTGNEKGGVRLDAVMSG